MSRHRRVLGGGALHKSTSTGYAGKGKRKESRQHDEAPVNRRRELMARLLEEEAVTA
jgi:hypothetical protein